MDVTLPDAKVIATCARSVCTDLSTGSGDPHQWQVFRTSSWWTRFETGDRTGVDENIFLWEFISVSGVKDLYDPFYCESWSAICRHHRARRHYSRARYLGDPVTARFAHLCHGRIANSPGTKRRASQSGGCSVFASLRLGGVVVAGGRHVRKLGDSVSIQVAQRHTQFLTSPFSIPITGIPPATRVSSMRPSSS